jgi:hypothetical protein
MSVHGATNVFDIQQHRCIKHISSRTTYSIEIVYFRFSLFILSALTSKRVPLCRLGTFIASDSLTHPDHTFSVRKRQLRHFHLYQGQMSRYGNFVA